MTTRRLTISQARRAALGASGLLRPRPQGRVDARHYRRVVADLDVVQLDSVNVVARAHELPFFSRLGPSVDAEQLRRYLWHSREVHECWAHVASLMPTDAYPLLRHRQQEQHPWSSIQRLFDEAPGFVDEVRAQVDERGPLTVRDLDGGGQRSRAFWGWSPGKRALHWLFLSGQIAVHERTSTFLAAYDAPTRVVPDEAQDTAPLPRDAAQEALLLRAARAQGVATADDLADHHRLPIREARQAVDRLARRGALVEVEVVGWAKPAYASPDLTIPRARSAEAARALLVPFDPLVWYRPRLQRLWDFDYTIEIYVPAAKRRYGYYVLPFLLGEKMAARVDLKADRRAKRLLVRGAWAEAGQDTNRVAAALAEELAALATYLGLAAIEAADNGDLAPALRRRLG